MSLAYNGVPEGRRGLASRYRSLTLLAGVLVVQLLLLAYQLRREQDIPLVRYGTVLVVTPIQKDCERSWTGSGESGTAM